MYDKTRQVAIQQGDKVADGSVDEAQHLRVVLLMHDSHERKWFAYVVTVNGSVGGTARRVETHRLNVIETSSIDSKLDFESVVKEIVSHLKQMTKDIDQIATENAALALKHTTPESQKRKPDGDHHHRTVQSHPTPAKRHKGEANNKTHHRKVEADDASSLSNELANSSRRSPSPPALNTSDMTETSSLSQTDLAKINDAMKSNRNKNVVITVNNFHFK